MSRFKDEIEFHVWRAAIVGALVILVIWACWRLK